MRGRAAFTLVELLVVIAIIGILVNVRISYGSWLWRDIIFMMFIKRFRQACTNDHSPRVCVIAESLCL